MCPPSDPVSCLPHPRCVVRSFRPLAISGYHPSYAHRTHTPLRAARGLPSPLLYTWVFLSGSPGRHPASGGGIGLYVRRFARDAERARLGRFVVVCVVESVGLRRARTQCGATALLLLPRRFLFHFPSSCYVIVIIAHAHAAARRDVTRWAVTTAIETVAVIATGGRPIARRAATSSGVVAAPRDATQLRETEVAAGWRPRRGGVVTVADRNARKLDLGYETNFFWYGCYENVTNSKSYVSRKTLSLSRHESVFFPDGKPSELDRNC